MSAAMSVRLDPEALQALAQLKATGVRSEMLEVAAFVEGMRAPG
jgi:hypothetical protein